MSELQTEQLSESYIKQERFVLWKRFCENKIALVSLVVMILIILCAVFADQIVSYDKVINQSLLERLQPPSAAHPFGTDGYGRDIFARVIHGTRSSLTIAFSTIFFSCFAGLLLGVSCGYFGGKLDSVVMRIVDVIMCLPPILFSLSIVAALGAGMENLILAVSITMTPYFTRVIRATVMSVTSSEYIEAARASGATDWHIILRHVIPNCMGPIIVEATINLSYMIMLSSSLSFIGLGVQPPSPEWGAMLSDGRENMRYSPWVVIAPGVAIVITSLVVNLLGDGLRDALDPRLKK